MEVWIFLVIICGILNGFNNIFQKKAVEKSTPMEALVMYVTLSFLLISYQVTKVTIPETNELLMILTKSSIIFLAWIFAFKAMSKLSISLYGITTMSTLLFSTTLGHLFLKDRLSTIQIIGMAIIILGLFLNSLVKNKKEKSEKKYVFLLLLACFFNALSSMLDKIITKTVEPSQLQWWFMLFLVILYWVYIILTKKKINYKSTLKNGWVYLLSIVFIVADRILFMANSDPNSQLTIIALLKQLAPVVVILVGGTIFKDTNLKYKLLCALVVIFGIFLIVV